MSVLNSGGISQTSNSEIITDMIRLQASQEIKLTEIDETSQNSNARLLRNIVRVSLAGGLSSAGTLLGGFVTDTPGIIGCGILEGVGNGVSTWLAWERKESELIESRIIGDFPLLVSKVSLIDEHLSSLDECIQLIYAHAIEGIEVEEQTFSIDEPTTDEKNQPWIWNNRKNRNFVRLFVAGALSAAGGWLASYEPTAAGIISGGILSGAGNVISTWFAIEKENDELIRKSALKLLPKLVQIAVDSETKLENLIKRIQALHPKFILEQTGPLKSILEKAEEDPACCDIGTKGRNFTYVNIAGWLSGAGSWIAGFIPNTAGILVGGATGGFANSISTWLMWENVNDKEKERVVLQDFPRITLKIIEISKRINILSEYVSYIELLKQDNISSSSDDILDS